MKRVRLDADRDIGPRESLNQPTGRHHELPEEPNKLSPSGNHGVCVRSSNRRRFIMRSVRIFIFAANELKLFFLKKSLGY